MTSPVPKSQGNTGQESTRITTGELTLTVIRSEPGIKMMTVHGKIDETPFHATVKPEAVQSFQKFQAAAFTAAGVWPRCQFAEGVPARSAAANWADMVSDAMSAGASG